MPLLARGGGLATGADVNCLEAELQRDELRRRDLGRLWDRMHVIGQRPKTATTKGGPMSA